MATPEDSRLYMQNDSNTLLQINSAGISIISSHGFDLQRNIRTLSLLEGFQKVVFQSTCMRAYPMYKPTSLG